MGEFSKILREIKEDKEKFVLIMNKFNPIIKKYMHLLYKDEQEDVHSELQLALWEVVCRIQFFDNDGQIVNYINTALRNKFLELYRNSRNYHDHKADGDVCDEGLVKNLHIERAYSDVMIEIDVNTMIRYLPESKKKIAKLLLKDGLTDTQASNILGLSRQYVNRVRKEIRDLFLQNYLNT